MPKFTVFLLLIQKQKDLNCMFIGRSLQYAVLHRQHQQCSNKVEYFQVGAEDTTIIVDIWSPATSEKITLIDPDGRTQTPAGKTQATDTNFIFRYKGNKPGVWTVEINHTDDVNYCTVSVRVTRKGAPAIAFNQDVGDDRGEHSNGVAFYPITGRKRRAKLSADKRRPLQRADRRLSLRRISIVLHRSKFIQSTANDFCSRRRLCDAPKIAYGITHLASRCFFVWARAGDDKQISPLFASSASSLVPRARSSSPSRASIRTATRSGASTRRIGELTSVGTDDRVYARNLQRQLRRQNSNLNKVSFAPPDYNRAASNKAVVRHPKHARTLAASPLVPARPLAARRARARRHPNKTRRLFSALSALVG